MGRAKPLPATHDREPRLRQRNVQAAATILGAAGLLFAAVNLVEGLRGAGSLWAALPPASLGVMAALVFGLARRGRAQAAAVLLLASCWLAVFASVWLQAGGGLIIGISAFAATTLIAVETLPNRQNGLAVFGAALGAIAAILLDWFGPASRPALLASVRFLLPIAAVVVVAVLILGIVRQYVRYTLRTKLIIGLLAANLFGVGSLGYLVNSLAAAQTQQAVGQALDGAAQLEAAAVGGFIARQVDVLISLSLDETLRAEIAEANAAYAGEPAADRLRLAELSQAWSAAGGSAADPLRRSRLDSRLAAQLRRFREKFDEHDHVIAVDRLGGLVAATGPTAGFDHSPASWWQPAGRAGEVFIGPPHADPASGLAAIIVAVPIADVRTGEMIGVLRSSVRAAVLFDLLEQSQWGATGRADLLLPGGELNMVGLSERLSPEEAAVLAAAGEEYTEATFQGSRRLISQAPVRSATGEPFVAQLGWVIVAHQDRDESLAPVAAQGRFVVVLTLAVAGLTTLGAAIIADGLVRPITGLMRAAERLADGDLGTRAAASSSDEIGALAVAFNQMAARLEASIASLEQQVAERRQAEAEVRKLNVELEERVAERTAQLQATAHELEAFSYSISHDLRSPLRAIDGFSHILQDDLKEHLADDSRRHLQRIREATQRMGHLIDDLLIFLQISRRPVHKQRLQPAGLVQQAWEGLRAERRGRSIELRVADLPECWGDPAMLRQVWANLLSNAVKFTRRQPAALVEVGSLSIDGQSAYFVRDNGAGFDMQYAGHLFGVFQRLHRTEEYEGTGLGLAVTQRIITRHGGRIWAAAAVDGGATFYFTLVGAAVDAGARTAPGSPADSSDGGPGARVV